MTDDEITTDGSEGYGASDITVLEGLGAVRKRPGMYIGSTGEHGLHHLVYEVIDNPVDKALTGYADHIEVMILGDGGLRAVDSGRDIPVDEHPSERKPVVGVVITILHARGEFSGDGYAVSGGLHGVGTSVVNALPTCVDTVIHRQGYVWRMSFTSDGHPITELVHGEATEETGTARTLYPDPEIFEATVFFSEILRRRFQQMAFLSKGLRITLTDERPTVVDDGDEITSDEFGTADDPAPGHRAVSYMYRHDLRDYVEYISLTKKNDVVNAEIIDFESENDEGTMSVEIATQWTATYSSSVHIFANTISATEDGTREEGFRTILTIPVNRYGCEKNIIKDKDDDLAGDDIREGLVAIISIKLSESQFEGQMKVKLGGTEARTFVQRQVCSQLGDQFDIHPAEAKAVIQKSQQAQATRVATRRTRKAIRRKGVFEPVSMPGKLRDYSSRKAEDCEIFIIEDDSTGGSVAGGRGPEHQVIVLIRGKILNVEKARLDRTLSSDTIRSLIIAFSTGIGEDFDPNKPCYGRIVIMADADVDDQHIVTLLLILLFRYMRPPTEQEHTYIAILPLYRIKWTNTECEFIYSDKERDKLLTVGQSAGYHLLKEGGIQRYRGLGGMSDHKLWETTMDPAHHTPKQVILDEAADTDEIFMILAGNDVDRRRSFIQHNVPNVCFLDT